MVSLLRGFATLLVLGPLIGLAFTTVGMLVVFQQIASGQSSAALRGLPSHTALVAALWSTGFGVVAFPLGMTLHAVLARATGEYSRYTWRLMRNMSILLCFDALPVGVISLILLFTIETFNKMRMANRPAAEETR